MPARTTAAEAARRRRLIRKQEKSGLPQAEFCHRQDVSLHAFRFWKYRGVRHDARPSAIETPRLVPVRLLGGVDNVLELEIRGGRTIRVRPGFDEPTLRRLVAVLENPSC